jgi:predicted dehydrogenase
MGKVHGEMIQKTPGLKLVAACELDPRLLETAQADFPGIAVFQDYRKLAGSGDVDLVVVITPHNTHRDIAVACLDAGCHVIVEKPMAITSAECTDMIEAARKKARMVTVFHNRRLDSDFLTLLELVQSGAIGDIVHIEAAASGRHRPGTWWRSDKKVSGGIMHDWGAHFLDWMFQFVPKPILSVSGHMKKCIWPHVTIEDSADAIIRFEGGVTGRFYTSSIDPTPYPRWRIVGTDGAITADNDGYDLWTDVGRARGKFKEFWGEYNGKYFYWNIAGHLIASDPLMIKPEEARKIISVVEATETSSKAGGEVRPNYC